VREYFVIAPHIAADRQYDPSVQCLAQVRLLERLRKARGTAQADDRWFGGHLLFPFQRFIAGVS
jgi:hypothetical protein